MPRPAPPKKRRSSLLPFYVLIGLVALALVAVLYSQLRKGGGGGGGGAGVTQPVPVTLTQAELQRVPGQAIGNANAPLTIYQFADFACGHCATFATFVEPVLKERLVQTGRARYVFYDFPLGSFPHSFLAARAARCAGEQGKFWEYHDALFQNQSKWSFESRAPFALFEEYAGSAGVANAQQFGQCLRSDKYAAEVSANHKLGTSLGVGGTPTLFVNGQRIDTPRTFAELEQELARIPGGAAAPAAGTAPAADSALADTAAPAATAAGPGAGGQTGQ